MDQAMIRQFLKGLAETLGQIDRDATKDATVVLMDGITLHPETQHAEIIYNNRRV